MAAPLWVRVCMKVTNGPPWMRVAAPVLVTAAFVLLLIGLRATGIYEWDKGPLWVKVAVFGMCLVGSLEAMAYAQFEAIENIRRGSVGGPDACQSCGRAQGPQIDWPVSSWWQIIVTVGLLSWIVFR